MFPGNDLTIPRVPLSLLDEIDVLYEVSNTRLLFYLSPTLSNFFSNQMYITQMYYSSPRRPFCVFYNIIMHNSHFIQRVQWFIYVYTVTLTYWFFVCQFLLVCRVFYIWFPLFSLTTISNPFIYLYTSDGILIIIRVMIL